MDEIREKINTILLTQTITENTDFLISTIPELRFMVGFDHRHPHHHLDVWNHTLEVVKNIDSKDLELKMAALLHDIGKPFSYQDSEVRHFHGHPEVSYQMTKEILKKLGYEEDFIDNVSYLVRMHDTIIHPNELDNDFELIEKRLKLQYADALAHHPDKVGKRIEKLDSIKAMLEKQHSKKIKIKKENV